MKRAQFNPIMVLILVIIAIVLIIVAIYAWWSVFQAKTEFTEPGVVVAIPSFLKLISKKA